MSRSGYTDDCDCDNWQLIRWRGAVTAAIKGKRGQAFLREMLAALDALAEKKLITDELEDGGQVCAIGSVFLARGISTAGIDPEEWERISEALGIPQALVREIEFENDDFWGNGADTERVKEQRFAYIRRWILENLRPEKSE